MGSFTAFCLPYGRRANRNATARFFCSRTLLLPTPGRTLPPSAALSLRRQPSAAARHPITADALACTVLLAPESPYSLCSRPLPLLAARSAICALVCRPNHRGQRLLEQMPCALARFLFASSAVSCSISSAAARPASRAPSGGHHAKPTPMPASPCRLLLPR